MWARIIIVAYNSSDVLQRCVDHVARQSLADFEVVIVDNDCPQNSVEKLHLPDKRFRTVKASHNLGFAAGCNFGAKTVNTPWLIMLNPDAFVEPDWLYHLKETAQAYPDVAALGTTLLKMNNPKRIDGFGDAMSIYGIAWRCAHNSSISRLPDHDMEVFGVCGAGAAYRTSIFQKMGGFDEELFCYLEDVDIAYRLQMAGYKIVQVRKAIARHIGSSSTGAGSDFQIYNTYRNNLRVIIKSSPTLLLPIMLTLHIIATTYLVYRNRHNQGHDSRIKGLKQAFKNTKESFGARMKFRHFRKTSTRSLIRKLAFSPASVRQQLIVAWDVDTK